MKKILLAVLSISAVLFLHSCKEEVIQNPVDDVPFNPYDTVDYGSGTVGGVPIDSASFLGIHTFILKPKCAQPACHDGAFEPDYRTVQSSYNTLVYHPVIKNDDDETFTYRVLPGDTTLSWLHERITTDDPVLGRMPLYDTLHPRQIEMIENWILNGAKDIFDNSPVLPNFQPSPFGLLAFLGDTTGMRLDTLRDDPILEPMQFPANSQVQLWFGLFDTDSEGNFLPSYDLTYNKVRFSDHPYDFSGTTEHDMTVEPFWAPFIGPPFIGNFDAPYYQHLTINTGDFQVGRTYYIRAYVQDANHSFPTEIPDNYSPIYFFPLFSFTVQ